MKERENYSIDGMDFLTQEYDYDTGKVLFYSLLKICGKSLLSFLIEGLDGFIKDLLGGEFSREELGSMTTTEVLARIDKNKAINAIDYFLQNIDPESMMDLEKKILQTTWIVNELKERRDINFKIDFKGKYGTSFKVLKKVLMLQFSSVFQNVLSGTAEPNKTQKEVKVGRVMQAR